MLNEIQYSATPKYGEQRFGAIKSGQVRDAFIWNDS